MSNAAAVTAMREVCTAFGVDPDTVDEATRKVAWNAMVRLFRAVGWKEPAEASPRQVSRTSRPVSSLPTTLPGYGRAANQPIATASKDDCRFYEKGCLRTLDDPSKERWHAKEQLMLEALRARLRDLGEAADYE